MAPTKSLFALCLIAAASGPVIAQAPSGGPQTRYCMRIEAPTGTRVERTVCWTRAKWEAQGVDIDRDWAENGVRTIG